ncbi:NAD-dependent epimerase/dehydratase family protein [Candidatus Kaiserbacteria bacterium]|nr:NAD-dependent epimerase/dehydratase family protein [Candidatus Kaiserbacteria bacterium]
MAKIVVTGGAGFVGSHIVDALIKDGHEVHVIDTFVAGKFDSRINQNALYHEVDIRDKAGVASVVQGAEVVFHLAALPRVQFSIDYPEESHDVNVNGTLSVLLACKEGKVGRVVYSGSSSAYGDQPTLPLSEGMTPIPKSPYALQKYVGEECCRVFSLVFGLPTVSFRYFNIYGPRFDPSGPYAQALGKFLTQKKNGKSITIWGDGTQTRDFVHVFDVVRANLLAATSPHVGKGEVINLGTGVETSVNDIANMIGGATVNEPARLEIARTRADISRAKALLQWEPTIKLSDAIEELKKEMGIA